MKYRNYIIALLAITFVLKGQSFNVGGQFRHRFEMAQKGLEKGTERIDFSYLRTRLNLSFNPGENVYTLIQIQDSRIMGQEFSTLNDGSADQLDFHQAYSKIKFNENFSIKLGRFEVNYGPQRLVGAVGWHNVGRSFDGLILNYGNKKTIWEIFNFKEVEKLNPLEKGDKNVSGLHGSFNMIPETKLEVLLIGENRRRTYSGFAKGRFTGIGYEFEAAIQNGNKKNLEYKGLMLAANLSYDILGLKLSGGVDYVSGDDSTSSAIESFNTLYATNHKYYGFMDYFLNLPVNTFQQGLFDTHLKLSLKAIKGIHTKLAWHSFKTADRSADFGQEIDITLKYKFNTAVLFQGGYSVFINSDLIDTNDQMGTWGYLMTVVNF